MREIKMFQFKDNVNVYYTNDKVKLPIEYKNKVENHWNELMKKGDKFFRGDVYTIQDIKVNDNKINIYVDLTDYAHFLYTIHKGTYTEYDCRVIHTSVLIETCDGKFVIGEMGQTTASPQKLQFIGGGIDKNDINGDRLDLKHNIIKEINEEIGIDINNKSIVKRLSPSYLKSGGKNNFLSAIFKMDLMINENQLKDLFNEYNKSLKAKGEDPEINSLIFIKKDKKSLQEFIEKNSEKKDNNLIATLQVAGGIREMDKI